MPLYSELYTKGGRYAISNRQRGIELFKQYLSRPWLGSELSINIIDNEPKGNLKRTEYSIPDGISDSRSYTVDVESTRRKANLHKSMILTGINVPDIGMDFIVNTAMAGHPQPQIKYGNMQIKFALPASRQNKYFTTPKTTGANVAAYLGMFGTLYDNQFTTYGTLRINPKKPNLVLALETYIVDGTEVFARHAPNSIQLFEFKGCNFTMPAPTQGDSSDLTALNFVVNVAFEDYDVYEGIHMIQLDKLHSLSEVAVGSAKSSYLETIARTQVSAEAAKKLSEALGKGLGFIL